MFEEYFAVLIILKKSDRHGCQTSLHSLSSWSYVKDNAYANEPDTMEKLEPNTEKYRSAS
jgi:hypothetical protein